MALFLVLLAGMIHLDAADATASKLTITGAFIGLLESEDAASPDPAVQIIPTEATAVADLHAEWRRQFFDVAATRARSFRTWSARFMIAPRRNDHGHRAAPAPMQF